MNETGKHERLCRTIRGRTREQIDFGLLSSPGVSVVSLPRDKIDTLQMTIEEIDDIFEISIYAEALGLSKDQYLREESR